MSDLGKIKGQAVRAFLVWYEHELGTDAAPEFRERHADGLPPHLRELLDPSREAYGMLASQWYSMELAHALMDRMLDDMSREELDALVWRAGPDVMASVLTGVQRRVFRLLMNPGRYKKYVQTAWSQNFDSGEIEVIEGENEHHGFVRGWRGHHRAFCRLIHSGKQSIYSQMGCKDVSVEMTGCISEGDEACSSRVRWAP